MVRKRAQRGLLSMVLAAALFFHALPLPVPAVTPVYQRITVLEELVTGQYVLVTNGGTAPGVLAEDWITAERPPVNGDLVTDAAGAVWTLRVEGDGVMLTDSGGVSIAPAGDGKNGITAGEGVWTVSCTDGWFSFHSFSGAEPVTLAANVSAEGMFRAYRDGTIWDSPQDYPSGFALYRLAEVPEETAPETEAATESTEETIPETEPEAPTEETTPETEAPELEWNLYFGQLHAHSSISDGAVSVEELFVHAVAQGMDFFAVTDHSDSFDNDIAGDMGTDGSTVSAEWAAGKAAAAAVTGENFVGIFGYEMSWPEGKQLGHISTFHTPGWQSKDQPVYADQRTGLEAYYEALTTVPGSVSKFNHPSDHYGDFEAFSHYSPAYDQAVSLLEVMDDCKYYIRALDKGWHVAPASGRESGQARTVILSQNLTETALYDAMADRRVYMTEDSDLTVYYQLNGHIMGSILPGASRAEIRVYLHDPTDAAIGTVEVIADGGSVLASQTVVEPDKTVTFSLPGSCRYYFIRVTQPDGDMAVTAPVWLEQPADMGIADFTADTQLPVRGQALGLTLWLYNNEQVDFVGETMVFSIDGEVIHAINLETIPGGQTHSYTFSYTHPGLGVTEILATVTGTVNGETRTYEKTLTLRYRMEDMVRRILVDGTHGNVPSVSRMTEIAAGKNIGVTVVAEGFTEELLESAGLLLIPAPWEPFEEEFLELTAEFVRNGGSLIVCGRSDVQDSGVHCAAECNRLLTAVGAALRLRDDTAVDEENNGGAREQLYVTNYNPQWDIGSEQVYCQLSGCTVEGGSWLVRGYDSACAIDGDGDGLGGGETAVLLAWEETGWGGRVFAAGSDFLSDAAVKEPKNYWDPASGNQGILEKLLDIEKVELPLTVISGARAAKDGEILRIRGYVTAGTSNQNNRFAETIYLQDDTGGIAVVSFAQTGIQVGKPMEVIGYRATRDGNPVLELIDHILPEEASYRYVPETMPHKAAMDYAANGGRLLQVEGTVTEFALTADGKGVSRIQLKDSKGDLAAVLIEDYIFSGATGKNTLASEVKKGKTVRVIGILHLTAEGETVLRVRNCDEVVYVPPNIIPRTGDSIGLSMTGMLLTGAALCLCRKKRE